jgi:hypothetical protein
MLRSWNFGGSANVLNNDPRNHLQRTVGRGGEAAYNDSNVMVHGATKMRVVHCSL